MARGRNRGLLLAGLAAGAYAYFKNPENRAKATEAFNNAKAKVNSYMESQNLENTGSAGAEDQNGGQRKSDASEEELPSVQYYNEQQEERGQKDKLSPNDENEEKAENTDPVSPNPRISTDHL